MKPPNPPPGLIYWFRQDLRLSDQPALARAIGRVQAASADRLGPQLGWLLPVFIHDPRQSPMIQS